jgi:hypothetical protein
MHYFKKGKEVGLEEEAYAEHVRPSENDTHPIVESDTVAAKVDATVPRRSVDPNCVPTPFDLHAAGEARGQGCQDVSLQKQFEDQNNYACHSCAL